MSWGWFWKCSQCLPTREFLETLKGCPNERLLKRHAVDDLRLPLEEADPFVHLELYSNREAKRRRCGNCNAWHHKDGAQKCKGYLPFEVQSCSSHSERKELLFMETRSAIVFIREAFCHSEGPPYICGQEYYDPYFFAGIRYEREKNGEFSTSTVVSSVRFQKSLDKKGRLMPRYGYSPYFYFREKELDEFRCWLDKAVRKVIQAREKEDG